MFASVSSTGTGNRVMTSQPGKLQFNASGSNMIFMGAGSIGVGTNAPVYKLQVVGDIHASGNIIAYSDARFKTDLQQIDCALDKVLSIHGYTFKRTDDMEGPRQVGVIAQELQKVLPEAISTGPDGTLSVAYGNIAALLIEAIRDLNTKVDVLAAKIN